MDGMDEKRGHEPANPFAQMHRELRNAHRALLAALADMEAVTRDPAPERERYSAARWRLSNVSFARRSLWQRIHQALADCTLGADAATLAELQQADIATTYASAAYVREWTAAAIDADWAGYCAASKEIRWQMKAAISVEQRLLYPLLARQSQAPGPGPQSREAA